MMSCGPVTAWALEMPATCRSFVATSRALPGDVSIEDERFDRHLLFLLDVLFLGEFSLRISRQRATGGIAIALFASYM